MALLLWDGFPHEEHLPYPGHIDGKPRDWDDPEWIAVRDQNHKNYVKATSNWVANKVGGPNARVEIKRMMWKHPDNQREASMIRIRVYKDGNVEMTVESRAWWNDKTIAEFPKVVADAREALKDT